MTGAAPAATVSRRRPPERRLTRRAVMSFRDRGSLGTLLAAAAFVRRTGEDLVYDLRRGIWTSSPVDLSGLHVVGDPLHGVHYAPIHAHTFLQRFRDLGVPAAGAFVDLGCGKGRALVLAVEHGFRDVVGVEFAAELAADAERTVRAYLRRSGRRDVVATVVHQDAARYDVRPQDQLFFLFNPFDEVVLAQVLDRVEASVAAHPRPVGLVYANPKHGAVLQERAAWALVASRPEPELFDWLYFRTGPTGVT